MRKICRYTFIDIVLENFTNFSMGRNGRNINTTFLQNRIKLAAHFFLIRFKSKVVNKGLLNWQPGTYSGY